MSSQTLKKINADVTEENIEYCDPKISYYRFNAVIIEINVLYEVYQFKDSLLLWIGEQTNPVFSDMSLALLSKFSQNPVNTRIMGSSADMASINLSSKLSKKLKKPVYVSFNLAEDPILLPAVYKRLKEEYEKFRNKF